MDRVRTVIRIEPTYLSTYTEGKFCGYNQHTSELLQCRFVHKERDWDTLYDNLGASLACVGYFDEKIFYVEEWL